MNKDTYLHIVKTIAKYVDSLNEGIGKLVSWLVLAMVLLVSYDVTMRYFFRSGSVALQELEWHIFSVIFLLGASYTFKYDDHVRLDLFYRSHFMNDYRRAWINIVGDVLLLIPFCLLIIFSSLPFVEQAFVYSEASPDPGGLSYRWLLKAIIPTGFIFLLMQGFGDFLKNLAYILDQPL